MQIIVVKKEKLYKYPFPNTYVQTFWVQDKDEYDNIQKRIALFQQNTGVKAGIVPTIITTCGLKRNAFSEHITCQILLDDLFK